VASRAEVCLRELISQLFVTAYEYPESIFAELMEYYGYLELSNSGKKKVIADFLPIDMFNVARIDDANLRTMCMEVYKTYVESEKLFDSLRSDEYDKYDIEKFNSETYICDEFKEHIDGSRLSNLKLLLEIFLFGSVEHIYSPLMEKRFEDEFNHVVHGPKHSEASVADVREFFHKINKGSETVANLTSSLKKKASDDIEPVVCALFNTMPPKVYKSDTVKSEEDVYIQCKYTEKIDSVKHFSEQLRNMKSKIKEDICFSIHFVSRNIKYNNSLKEKCDRIYEEFIEDVYLESIRD